MVAKLKPPDPETLAILHRHPLYKGALSVVKKKIKKDFKDLKTGTKDKRLVKKHIRQTLKVADRILTSYYYKGLYEQEWDLYDGPRRGFRKKFEDVRSFIELLLSYPSLRIGYPKTVKRSCDKYLEALEDHYT